MATAAENAHTTTVARLALTAAHIHSLTPAQLLKETSITPSTTSTFITFSVTDRFPARAQQLATTYARTYVKWSNQKAIHGIQGHINSLQTQIDQLNRQIKIQEPRTAPDP